MTASNALAALAPGILVMLLTADAREQQEKPAENPEKRLALSKINVAAEELESLVLALGLDAHRGDPSAEHPSREDRETYQRAGFASSRENPGKKRDDESRAREVARRRVPVPLRDIAFEQSDDVPERRLPFLEEALEARRHAPSRPPDGRRVFG